MICLHIRNIIPLGRGNCKFWTSRLILMTFIAGLWTDRFIFKLGRHRKTCNSQLRSAAVIAGCHGSMIWYWYSFENIRGTPLFENRYKEYVSYIWWVQHKLTTTSTFLIWVFLILNGSCMNTPSYIYNPWVKGCSCTDLGHPFFFVKSLFWC